MLQLVLKFPSSLMTTASSTSSPLVYQAIKHRLARHIGTRWRAGSRMPPIDELARELGTGQRNTHRAVQELVRDGILVSRPGMGTFVSGAFEPSQLPGSDANGAFDLNVAQPIGYLATKRVELVRNGATQDGFQSYLADTLVRQLNAAGIAVKTTLSGETQDSHADAVVMINPPITTPIEPRPGQIMTVITMGLDVDLHATRGVDFVSVDQIGSAMLAGQRLREAGCDSVCFIGCGIRGDDQKFTGAYDRTASLRLEGFERGWGAAIPQHLRLYSHAYDIGIGARMVAQYLKLDPRPTGVFCATDELAAGFVIGGLAVGIESATDYKIIGFDGQPIGRNLSEGPLTTVEAPLDEMASRAAELLIDRLGNPDQPVRRLAMGCRLFEGQTVEASRLRLKARQFYKNNLRPNEKGSS